ncbi:DUF1566 domain-containing protein [Cerasicoccus frondis]|uniref:Lcl domain-containing protein n=1 Tax=Cerasicoccus frondis TaxID=490090 RepID=UPI002852C2D6|nr:DUF1566 domain-containing protein [Cerasicoccus frondis]
MFQSTIRFFFLYIALASWLVAQPVVTSVSPASADVGVSGVTVDITMSNTPQPPRTENLPLSVTIGELVGVDYYRDNRNHVAATFDIPDDISPGEYDVMVAFETPMGSITYTGVGVFTVTDAESPPVVTQHPQSLTAPLGRSAVFNCAVTSNVAVTYQWFHQGDEIDGAVNAELVVEPVEETSGGQYYCVITNAFGFVETNLAVLTLFTDRYLPPYAIVDTNQTDTYGERDPINQPSPGNPFLGQDGQFTGNQPLYSLNGDGLTVYDNVTRLTWLQTTDTNRDGEINANDKLTIAEAALYIDSLNNDVYGGYSDWRVPTMKEIYSLIDFTGVDASGDTPGGVRPFINTDYFAFAYGDETNGERRIDAQYMTATQYVSTVFEDEEAFFGLNLADGRVKGYPADLAFYVLPVRGNPQYGVNQFVDNGDGTITDRATGLMWEKADSGVGLIWEDALAYGMASETAGYRDWRLPNAKELQSIIDYSRAPDVTGSPAIDPLFTSTAISNEAGQTDYPWYWSSTTFLVPSPQQPAVNAVYFCFGRGMGYYNGAWLDVHGAGAQRSDPKTGELTDYDYAPDGYYSAMAPQGDAVRIFNFARCVRGGALPPGRDMDEDGLSDWYEYDYVGDTTSMEADADDDGDLFSNLMELRAGTLPDDNQSYFALSGFTLGDVGATISWRSALDRYYVVFESTDLVEFTPISDVITGAPPSNVFEVEPDGEATFYRVELVSAPGSPPPPADE